MPHARQHAINRTGGKARGVWARWRAQVVVHAAGVRGVQACACSEVWAACGVPRKRYGSVARMAARAVARKCAHEETRTVCAVVNLRWWGKCGYRQGCRGVMRESRGAKMLRPCAITV